jgi:hypothetical protein
VKTYTKEQVASVINGLRLQKLPLYTLAADMLTSLLDENLRMAKRASASSPAAPTKSER